MIQCRCDYIAFFLGLSLMEKLYYSLVITLREETQHLNSLEISKQLT